MTQLIAVYRSTAEGHMLDLQEHLGHATLRWTKVLFAIVDSPNDIKTVDAWGLAIAASPGVIRSICALVKTSPKQSLDFGRVLRLVIRGQLHLAAELLHVDDPRTIARLLNGAGIHVAEEGRHNTSVAYFLNHQTFITNETALVATRVTLKHRGLL